MPVYRFSERIITSSKYPWGTTPPLLAVEAMSVIFDIADNYGRYSWVGMRSVEFYFEGTKHSLLTSTDFTALHTSRYSYGYESWRIFDATRVNTGGLYNNAWISGSGLITNQRVRINFVSPLIFDQIIVNNVHDSGGSTDGGVKNVKVYYTMNPTEDIQYGSHIPSGVLLFDGQFKQHVNSNIEDPEIIWEK